MAPDVAAQQDVSDCMQIIQLRRFRDCYQEIQKTEKYSDLPDTPMMKLALAAMIEAVRN